MTSTAHWDSYWQASRSLNSFGEGEAASGYEGELLALWNNSFKQLADNATVLDVGTGNGAIAVAARKYSNLTQRRFTIYGADAANIKPLQVFADNSEIAGLLATITFYPECKTEALPFADASVDLVTSQFAFEYAERDAALHECIRVLKPAGQFMAIMHHTNSDIAKDSAAGVAVLNQFLNASAFFKHARTLLACMAEQAQRAETPALVQRTQQANQSVLNCSRQIKQQLGPESLAWYNDVMARVAKLIVNFSVTSMTQLDIEQQRLALFLKRLVDQQQASLSTAGAAELSALLTARGYAYQLTELNIEEHLFGWLLKIKK
ncbi:MAG: hypothetical protein CML20_21200 [Rheinheimera sp.]|uniref:class I SAM-dependent methyltransferase n=1 Tax=Arsukibacterium sp. UBA3155 TaxID=1946058 RepID=UPI000C8ACBBD|nr:class I SAM-dependent methyltransferase [Arsukibacterium sp. UBA3155]MAD77262.1 hypothetical protein [Rheinheimera sp.]|tara:strand:+ start:108860 stop:109822 length:963 start_codon:yes stop_codon:yes gene_type:complete